MEKNEELGRLWRLEYLVTEFVVSVSDCIR